MQRKNFERAAGIYGFKVSKLVTKLDESAFRSFPHKHGGVSWTAKKTILRVLADHYPNIWPSVGTIAQKAGLHDRQTQKGLGDLEKDGYIRAVSSKKGGSASSVQYELNVNQIRVQAEWKQSTEAFTEGWDAAWNQIKQKYPPEDWKDHITGWVMNWNFSRPWEVYEHPFPLSRYGLEEWIGWQEPPSGSMPMEEYCEMARRYAEKYTL